MPKLEEMSVEQLNAVISELERNESEIREVKRRVAGIRSQKIEFEQRVIRLSRLSDSDLKEFALDQDLLEAILKYKKERNSGPPPQSVAPEPVQVSNTVAV